MFSHQLFLSLFALSLYTVSAGGKHLARRQGSPIVTSAKVVTRYTTVAVTNTINVTVTSTSKVTPASVPTTVTVNHPEVTVTVTKTTTIVQTATAATPHGSAGQPPKSGGTSN